MTQQLRTLKDFENLHEDKTTCSLLIPLLKQEAIKWIKEFEKANVGLSNEDIAYGQKFEDKETWIKHFFNITNKELK